MDLCYSTLTKYPHVDKKKLVIVFGSYANNIQISNQLFKQLVVTSFSRTRMQIMPLLVLWVFTPLTTLPLYSSKPKQSVRQRRPFPNNNEANAYKN